MDLESLSDIAYHVLKEKASSYHEPILGNTPLGPDGLGFDSIGILDLVLELESRTGLLLREENLTGEALSTPDNLIQYLEQSRSGRHG